LRTAATSNIGIVNLDKLTYAGNPQNLERLLNSSSHTFVPGDICDRELVELFCEYTQAARGTA
jgi:dTDP-glucose 4,6-dehydratase